MQALVTTPGEPGSTRTEPVADPERRPGGVLIRTLEVGVCGTDREIDAGEDGETVVAVPPALGRHGVLAEPASICARAIRHTTAIGNRQPWQPARALVL